MKNKFIFLFTILFMLMPSAYSKSLSYEVEAKDQLGSILLSLGHRKLWNKSGKVHYFKRSFKSKLPSKLIPGMIIHLDESEVNFKKNVIIDGGNLKILRKIKTLDEFDELLKAENLQITEPENLQVSESDKNVTYEVEKSVNAPESSFSFYPGIGFFVSSNAEKDNQISTTTFSGLQPLVQIKSIYSNDLYGAISVDVLAKKIISGKFKFPINLDYRLQFIPKWNFTDYFRFALSHSKVSHSYVGKHSDSDIGYELKSGFIGVGLVLPLDYYWFEFYIEKMYLGQTSSLEYVQNDLAGFRLDSELVYPLTSKFKLIPGASYYNLKNESSEYRIRVFEARLSIARDFEF